MCGTRKEREHNLRHGLAAPAPVGFTSPGRHWTLRRLFIRYKHQLVPQVRTVCEVGCGAGEILSQLHKQLPGHMLFHGYEISPYAFEKCLERQTERLVFHLKDLLQEETELFDLVLTIDIVEHIEDYFGFLRRLRSKGKRHIFHIPLDMSVNLVLRGGPMLRARESVGHLHFFAKETALATLKDTGYQVVDYVYTAGATELPNPTLGRRILALPRRMAFRVHPDWAVRLLGGYSLLVLAE